MILVMSDGLKDQIKEIIDHAHAHPLSLEDVKATVEGKKEAIGISNLAHTIRLPIGFKVVYSEEYQPMGLYKHLSISVGDGQPPPEACNMILEEFGFRNRIIYRDLEKNLKKEFVFWVEGNYAINFLESYERLQET